METQLAEHGQYDDDGKHNWILDVLKMYGHKVNPATVVRIMCAATLVGIFVAMVFMFCCCYVCV